MAVVADSEVGRRIWLADVEAEQAADECGDEAGRELAQLLRRGLLANANDHDDEQHHDEDSYGPTTKMRIASISFQLLQRRREAGK
jgi:hypothetical protein